MKKILIDLLLWLDEATNRETTSMGQYAFEGRVFKYFKPRNQKEYEQSKISII